MCSNIPKTTTYVLYTPQLRPSWP